MKRRSIAMLVVAITVVLASCVSLGPTFMKEPSIPEGKALVYIYRLSSIVGSAVSYLVHADEMPVVTLYNGGYYPYLRWYRQR